LARLKVMPETAFKPPSYLETTHYVYDKRSGKILATETRWALRLGRQAAEPRVADELLQSIAKQNGRRKADLAVITFKAAKRTALRIDLKKRRPVFAELPQRRLMIGPGRPPSP
jgi:hypothetical protein